MDIVKACIDLIEKSPDQADAICDGGIALLKKHCPSFSFRNFVKLVEKYLRRRGDVTGGMLIVPNEHSLSVTGVSELFSAQSTRKINFDRKIDPDLIGGAVVLVDHRRIDSSVQGALQMLLKNCLLPLD